LGGVTIVNKPLQATVFDRADDEWYVEPIWASDALFEVESFDGGIWDPACGGGNIFAAAVAHGHMDVVGTDIVQRWSVAWSVLDFFNCTNLRAQNIVTNPPFGRAILAEKFIRHAISLKPRKLAVFVGSRFLFGKARAAGLFAEFPPARIWLITPRPSCPPGEYLAAGNKAGGGTADYCWMVWEPLVGGEPVLGWLRCAP
jgi:hypothetical protein